MKQRLHQRPFSLTHQTSVWLLASGLQAVGCGNDSGGPSPATNADVTNTSTSTSASTTSTSLAPSVSSPINSSSTSGNPSSTNGATSETTGTTPTGSPTTPTASSNSESATSDGVNSSSEADVSGASAPHVSSEPSSTATEPPATDDPKTYAVGFHELYLHDECTDDNPSDDVCAHARVHEVSFAFGGDPATTYDVKLRIRGLFEPTNVSGGETPDAEHPYFKVNGNVEKPDYSQWQIVVGEPSNTYYLNHYPEVGHTIYKEDFEATIQVRGEAEVKVRVEDANDRQIDNGYVGNPDRQQRLEGVTEEVVDGQVLRLDVLDVTAAR